MTWKDERNGAERCWIWRDGHHYPQVAFSKPQCLPSVEYMRVLSRDEVEKLAEGEGADIQQLLNSLMRTIEGQRNHIARLMAKHEKVPDETLQRRSEPSWDGGIND